MTAGWWIVSWLITAALYCAATFLAYLAGYRHAVRRCATYFTDPRGLQADLYRHQITITTTPNPKPVADCDCRYCNDLRTGTP